MSDRIQVDVVATDKASDKLRAVGTAAQGMGQQLATAGNAATTAGRNIETSGTKASTAGVSWAAFGAAVTTAAGFLGTAATAAADSAASAARLETAVENAGGGFDEFNAALEAAQAGIALGFDDEDTQDALSNLIANTGSVSEALALLPVAMDLARGRGIDLAVAAQALGRAANGQVGALQRMGIAIEEGATAQEALNTAAETYSGQAEAYAETTAGAADTIRIKLDNLLETIGENTGGFQTLLALLPGLSVGFTAAGGAAGLVASGFKKATPAIAALRAESALASLALGPVGLVVAGVAAVGVLGELTDWFGLAGGGAKEATVDIDGFADSLVDLARSGASAATIDTVKGIQDAFTEAANALQGRDLQGELDALSDAYVEASRDIENAPTLVDALASGLSTGVPELDAILNEYRRVNAEIGSLNDQAVAQAQSLIESLTSEIGAEFVDNDKLLADLELRTQQFEDGIISLDEYTRYLQDMRDNFSQWYVELPTATEAIDANTEAVDRSANAVQKARQAWADYRTEQAAAAAEATTAFHEAVAEFVGDADNILRVLSATPGQAGFLQGVNDLVAQQGALDATFRVIVGGTRALGDSSQQVADWAEATLTGADAQVRLQGLVQAGIIGQDQYNAAQQAGVSIALDNQQVQQDLLGIQAQQAPFIAEQTAAYAELVHQISLLPPEQQLVALGFTDAGERAQVADAYALAYKATVGEIPKEVATELIANSANADPVLAAMLEQLGLITKDETGAWVVNFDDSDARTMQDVLADLTFAIQQLNQTVARILVSADTSPFYGVVNPLIGSVVGTAYIAVQALNPNIGFTEFRHGGVVDGYDDTAQHGLISRGTRRVLMNEAGPEIVTLPNGSAVIPAPASQQILRGQGGGKAGLNFYGPVTFVIESGDVASQIMAQAYAGAR